MCLGIKQLLLLLFFRSKPINFKFELSYIAYIISERHIFGALSCSTATYDLCSKCDLVGTDVAGSRFGRKLPRCGLPYKAEYVEAIRWEIGTSAGLALALDILLVLYAFFGTSISVSLVN